MQKNKHYVGLIIALLVSGAGVLLWRLGNSTPSPTTPNTPPKTVIPVSSQPSKQSPSDSSPQKKNNQRSSSPPSRSTEETKVSFGETVVRTNQAEAVLAYARHNTIPIIQTIELPSGESLVSLGEADTSPAIQQLAATFSDSVVSKNFIYKTTFDFSDPDPYYQDGSQWNLRTIRASRAWDITTGSSDTTIAVIDTGVLFEQSWGVEGPFSHIDFPTEKQWQNSGEQGVTALEGDAPNCTSRALSLDKNCNNLDDDSNGFVDDWQGWDFMGGFVGDGDCPNNAVGGDPDDYVNEDNDPQPYSCDSPDLPSQLNKTHYSGACDYDSGACAVGHGTMSASTAAATSDNGEVITGVNHDAKVMNIRALDGYGYGSSLQVAASIEYAVDNGADVINLSLSMDDCSAGYSDATIEAAITAAKNADVIVVAAAGNEGGSSSCYPASSVNAIGVGATNSSDNLASFSNYGSAVDLVAPGVNIPVANAPTTFYNSNYYGSADGTSFSAPHVAGVAGLIKAIDGDATFDEVRSYLIKGAAKVSAMKQRNFTNKYGYGRLNANNTLNIAMGRYPTYRLKHTKKNSYLLLKNGGDIENAVYNSGYKYEGFSFWSTASTETDAKRVYRLYHAKRNDNMYTTSPSEVNRLKAHGYTNKGTAFWAPTNGAPSANPLYRLYHPYKKQHVFTTTSSKINTYKKAGYRYEGVGFWTY